MQLGFRSSVSVAVLLLATGGAVGQASAQTNAAAATPPAPATPQATAPAGAGTTLGVVVVTARKRTENLQTVPVAVTALSGSEVEKQNVVTISGLGLTVPNFKVDTAPSNGTAPIIAIRGQVQNDTLSTLDPSVGVYVDGVYWSRTVGADAALVDVTSAEVLKGPQGTLFGRNTTGGALNIHTNDPNLNSYSGLASLTGGTYNELDGTLVLNAPIIEDKLAVRFAFNHNGHDGYTYDTTTNQRLDSQDNTTYRVKILAQPTDKARIEVSFEDYDLDQLAAPAQLSYVQPTNITATGIQGAANLDAGIASGLSIPQILGSNQPLAQSIGAKPHSSTANDNTRETARTQTLGVTGTYDLGFGVLKLIGGYRKVNSFNGVDLDGTAFTILNAEQHEEVEEYTGEAQLTGKVFNDRLDYAIGYFWFKEAGLDMSNAEALVPLNPDNPTIIDGNTDNRSQAGYAQGTYRITSALSFTGGVRYSSDHKALVSHNGVVLPGTGFSCAVPDAVGAPQSACSQEFGTSSSDVDYTASLDYRFTREILGYIKVAHGYRAGGDNIRGSITPQSFAPFAPETALNYEAGLKSEYFNHRLRINVAGYYTDYKNIQRSIILETPSGGTETFVANAAAGKVYGGELEAQALVLQGLRLGMSLGVTEASYDQYQDALGNHVNENFPYTPTITYSLTGDYTHSAPLGSVNFHADWGWQSTTYFDVGYTNGGANAANFPTSSIRQSPYGLLNMRIAWDIDDPNLEIAFFGRNVGNKTYRTAALDFVDAGVGINSVFYGAPATFGVQATYKFGN